MKEMPGRPGSYHRVQQVKVVFFFAGRMDLIKSPAFINNVLCILLEVPLSELPQIKVCCLQNV